MPALAVHWKTRWWFSPWLIVLYTVPQALILFWALWKFFPATMERELQAGLAANLATFLLVGFFQSIVEYGGHRYFMHCAIVSWFAKLITWSHGKHHALTSIVLLDEDTAGAVKMVYSRYVVATKSQHYGVAFDDYFLAAFYAGYAILLAPLQRLFPLVPFLLGGYVSLTVWIMLYDIFHQLEHKPDEWWEKRKFNPILSFFRRYHQYHHFAASRIPVRNLGFNMAIVGFFGLPVIDSLCGTLKLLSKPLRDGDLVRTEDLMPPTPCWLIRRLDAWALKREQRLLGERAQKNREEKPAARMSREEIGKQLSQRSSGGQK